MNKRIDYSNIGGFPLDEDALDFMQQSYRGALSAIAKLCGDKVILTGIENAAGDISEGWFAYGGELIFFEACPENTDVVITEDTEDALFEDDNTHTVYYSKKAVCGVVGDFPFTDLVRLSSLQNIWLPGDLKQKYVDNDYITANFDGDGYGTNAETGWRIFSAVQPLAAGKVFVNLDPADATFDTMGSYGGAKTHTLAVTEIPPHNHVIPTRSIVGGTVATSLSNYDTQNDATDINTGDTGGGGPHNNLQPYFVVLTLIKL